MKRTRLKPQSAKRAAEHRRYLKLRAAYMEQHPVCEGCRVKPATDLHHKAGRGKRLCEVLHFMAVCRSCHDWLHENGAAAERLGWRVRMRRHERNT